MDTIKFNVFEREFIFELDIMDGEKVLKATHTKDGEIHTMYTSDADRLPWSEEEADEFINGLDWNELNSCPQ